MSVHFPTGIGRTKEKDVDAGKDPQAVGNVQ